MKQEPTPFGGQALIEGVMVRGPRAVAMAVRAPDGRIVRRSLTTDAALAARVRHIPYVRGLYTLYETFMLGTRALYWSSKVATGAQDERISKREITSATAMIAVASATFVAGPVLLTGWIDRTSLEVLGEGSLRVAMIIGYIWFVGRLPEVQRVFAYHGAEHRAIHAMEHGRELTVDAVRGFKNAHPRCGTAFLLTVGVLSFAVFALLGTPPLWERIVERVLLTPLIAAVAYEFLRASQRWEDHRVLRVLQFPNLWLQKLTTRDPDDGQVEVAIVALQDAIAQEAALEFAAAEGVPAASLALDAPLAIEADD